MMRLKMSQRIRIVRINEDCLRKRRHFIFPICALAIMARSMQKKDSAMIFLMHFTLTLYRDFHV